MNTFDAIRERRAVKHFDPSHEFTKQETDQLLDLAMQVNCCQFRSTTKESISIVNHCSNMG